MEKKEMSFIEKFAAAGKELEKAMVESNKDAMIMIAIEGDNEKGVSANIKGKSNLIGALLSYVACKCDDFKTVLMDVIKISEMQEQEQKNL